MGQHREELKELSKSDPLIRRAMDLVYCGEMDYEQAMETLVISKHREAEAYKQQLLDRMTREGPPPVTMPIDEFCKNHCTRSHG